MEQQHDIRQEFYSSNRKSYQIPQIESRVHLINSICTLSAYEKHFARKVEWGSEIERSETRAP